MCMYLIYVQAEDHLGFGGFNMFNRIHFLINAVYSFFYFLSHTLPHKLLCIIIKQDASNAEEKNPSPTLPSFAKPPHTNTIPA